jgi:hypothetical protein
LLTIIFCGSKKAARFKKLKVNWVEAVLGLCYVRGKITGNIISNFGLCIREFNKYIYVSILFL